MQVSRYAQQENATNEQQAMRKEQYPNHHSPSERSIPAIHKCPRFKNEQRLLYRHDVGLGYGTLTGNTAPGVLPGESMANCSSTQRQQVRKGARRRGERFTFGKTPEGGSNLASRVHPRQPKQAEGTLDLNATPELKTDPGMKDVLCCGGEQWKRGGCGEEKEMEARV